MRIQLFVYVPDVQFRLQFFPEEVSSDAGSDHQGAIVRVVVAVFLYEVNDLPDVPTLVQTCDAQAGETTVLLTSINQNIDQQAVETIPFKVGRRACFTLT